MRSSLFPRRIGTVFLALFFTFGLVVSVAQAESLSVSIASPSSGTVLTVGQSFSMSASIGGGEPWYSYWFDTGDGFSKGSPSGSSQNVTVSHTYRNPGTYTITLSVQDKNTSGGFLPSSLSGSDSVTVTVIGTPEPITYPLTVNKGSGGGRYRAGEAVSITANIAGVGKVFDRWIGGTVADPTMQTTTLIMPAGGVTLTAQYRDISVPKTPSFPSVTSVAPSPIVAGETLTVYGSHFTPSGSVVSVVRDGQTRALSTTFVSVDTLHAVITETLPAGVYQVSAKSDTGESVTTVPVTVSAKLLPPPPPPPAPTYILTVFKSGAGLGTVSGNGISCGSNCTETFDADTAVILTASPTSESAFTGWSGGGCSGAGLSCLLLVNGDTTVTATFEVEPPAVVSRLFSVLRPVLSDSDGVVSVEKTVRSDQLTISGTFTTKGDFSVAGPISGVFQYAPVNGSFVDWVQFTLPLGLKESEKATASYTWRVGGGNWRFRLCVAKECGEELLVSLGPTSVNEETVSESGAVLGGKPRLAVSSFSWSGLKTRAGKLKAGTMKVSADIINQGDTTSEATTGRFEYSRDGENFAPWVNFSVPVLSPGAKSKISYTWEGGVGVWFLRACVGEDVCSETTEEEIVSTTLP